jgi:UDP-N-acetyl-2-amino-2-deoxyglucuronate dehydrogenase
MSEPTQLALVGCGGITDAHVRAYRDLWERGCRDFEIAVCCDIDPSAAETRSAQILEFQGKKPAVASGVDALVAAGGVGAADVCLPHAFHHAAAIALLDAGIHVLVEKPVGITMKAGRKIIDAATRANRIVATAENIRRMPGPRAARWALIEAKLIGDVHVVQIHHNQYGPFDFTNPAFKWRGVKLLTGGGMIMDSGAHLGDMMVHLFGDPDTVFCRMDTIDPAPIKDVPGMGDVKSDTEDAWQAIVSFKNGVVLNWTYSRSLPGTAFAGNHYYGSKGSMTAEGFPMHPFQDGSSLIEADGTTRSPEWLEEQYLETLSADEREALFPFGATDGFSIEVYDFIRAVRGGQPVEMDGEAGLRAKALCMACYESAAAGRAVTYRDVLDGTISAYQDPIDAHWGI